MDTVTFSLTTGSSLQEVKEWCESIQKTLEKGSSFKTAGMEEPGGLGYM